MLRPILRAALMAGFISGAALADDTVRDRIAFQTGSSSATVKAAIKGEADHEYLVGAKAGQVMTVKLATRNTSTYFNVWAPGKVPGKDEALFAGAITGDAFSDKLTETGDYMVQVYLYRNAARRNETADFTLTVEVIDGAAAAQGEDFADGLSGGPDFWEVKGLAGRTVNLREQPTRSAGVVEKLAMGTILRNKGCRMEAGQRWCRGELPENAAIGGWVAGQFLREAAVGGASSDDKLVAGTNYHAVGRIPCTLEGQPNVKDCEFGVTRGAPGVATIFITLPNAFVRVLSFDGPEVKPDSAVTGFSFSRSEDNTIVKVNGQDETYVIPDAVINGG